MNKSDYAGGETVGELIDRLAHSYSAMIEAAKERFLNMPAEKLITILVMVAILMLLIWGMVALEIFVKDKREQRRLRQMNSDDGDHPEFTATLTLPHGRPSFVADLSRLRR